MNPSARLGGAASTLVLAAALLGWVAAPAGAQIAPIAATVIVTPRSAAPGAEVRVEGDGWPSRVLVMVEVCGNNALLGSPDCAQSTARTVSTSSNGRLLGQVTVPTPPSPCPCVVRAFVPTRSTSAATEFEVVGHPTAPLRELGAVQPPALTLRANVETVDGAGALFGLRPERILHLEIENISEAPVVRPRLIVSWGRSANGDGYIEVPPIESVAAGETVTLNIPFELAPVAIGSYVVTGQILGVDGTPFAIKSASMPWGLLVVPVLLAIHLSVARLRRRLRRRSEREEFEPVEVRQQATRRENSDAATWAVALGVGHQFDVPRAARSDPVQVIDKDDEEDHDLDWIEEFDEEDGIDDEDGLVGVGAGPAPRRRRTYVGLSLALLASIGLLKVHSDAVEPLPLSAAELCDALSQLDVVNVLAGDVLEPKKAVADDLAALADRAPAALQPALRDVADAVVIQADLQSADALDPDKPDAWNVANVAARASTADREFVDAAPQVEQFAVEQCGMQPSGRFDVAVIPGSDAAAAGPGAGPALQSIAQLMDVAAAEHAQASEPPVFTMDLPELREALNQRQG